MTEEAKSRIERCAGELIKARRAWLESTARTLELQKSADEARQREYQLNEELLMARREMELAVYDAEG